jgi:peptidoglycan/xylan/chitin deacetylase (PgdA/CDA1 family)
MMSRPALDMSVKEVKKKFYAAAKRLGLFAAARRFTGSGIRILCYHGVWIANDHFGGDALFMRPRTFERRLELIHQLGYPVIPLSMAIDVLGGKATAPPAAVVLTIDDGWYSTFSSMWPALKRRRFPATLYCDTAHLQERLPIAHVMAQYLRKLKPGVGSDQLIDGMFGQAIDCRRPMRDRLAATLALAGLMDVAIEPYLRGRVFEYMTPAELKELARDGLNVELHTHMHTMHDLSPGKIWEEVSANRQALSHALERDPLSFRHFCYPSGIASDKAAMVLADLGLASATSTERGIAYPGSMPYLLPRFLDGEQLSEIEFEAELSGFAGMLRTPSNGA